MTSSQHTLCAEISRPYSVYCICCNKSPHIVVCTVYVQTGRIILFAFGLMLCCFSVACCRDIREAFVRAKYETKAWIPRVGDDSETLSKALCVSAMTSNVQRSYELICSGANVRRIHTCTSSVEVSSKTISMTSSPL